MAHPPVQEDLVMRTLSPFIRQLAAVNKLKIEFIPDEDIFGDQSKFGGVDSDVCILGETDAKQTMIILLETKFEEREFSACGFRKSGRAKHESPV
jgi:hypothetical protein